MPHQCTNCGRTFADGSKEMLSGCPDCGGNKFQFRPAGAQQKTRVEGDAASGDADASESGPASETTPPTESPQTGESPSTPAEPESTADSAPPEPEGSRASDDDIVDADDQGEVDRPDWSETGTRPTPGKGTDSPDEEDNAQKDARSSVASSDELDRARELMAQAERERMEQVDSEDASTSESSGPESPESTGSGPAQADADSGSTDSAASSQSAPAAADQTATESPAQSSADDTAAGEDLSGPIGESGTGGDEPPSNEPAGEVAEEKVVESPDNPDLAALREELNNQFESIKIVAPGQYELNLMELYDRQEYIISLREDGKYVIEVPDSWHADE